MKLRYMQDNLVRRSEVFDFNLTLLGSNSRTRLKEIAVITLDDINNELVARWAQINVRSAGTPRAHIADHKVTIDDQQPKGNNSDQLSRLPPA